MLFVNALQQSLIFLPLAIGIYLSYRILNVTDLTVDGTFVLGAAIFSRCVSLGLSEGESFLLAIIGGFMAGVVVCCMQRYANINSLIASILAVFMLYSINFAVMGRPNISLLGFDTLLADAQIAHPKLLLLGLIAFSFFLLIGLSILLHSRFGLGLRAFGVNARLLKKIGKHPTVYLAFGLGLSNALAAFCGVMTAEINGYADINMGLGMALTAIGAVVIGQKITHSVLPKALPYLAVVELLSCFIGAMIYFIAMNGFLSLGVNPIYLKLLLGLVLVVFLSASNLKGKGGYYDNAPA